MNASDGDVVYLKVHRPAVFGSCGSGILLCCARTFATKPEHVRIAAVDHLAASLSGAVGVPAIETV